MRSPGSARRPLHSAATRTRDDERPPIATGAGGSRRDAFSHRPQAAHRPSTHHGHSMPKILILGVNGFIGHHLSQRIIADTDWEVFGMDMQSDRIADLLTEKRFHFFEGDITINREWIEYHVKKCDTVLPLVAIATPATYVREPLRVFELDFEANLPIVRHCVRYRKRIIFPSTSEVYGMSRDEEFDPEASELVLGPINKPRWIYSCAKQLMDRVIHAYGMQEGLDYTLFRPFNWIGSGLDSINTAKEGSSRVITQFLGHIVRGEPIKLVDGGTQKRAFTYIDDGIAALMKVIANDGGIATGKIYNIGNPRNNYSVREVATMMLDLALTYPEYRDSAVRVKILETTSAEYYGKGYQDVQNRVPRITNTCSELGWQPTVPMDEALKRIFDAYRGQVAEARRLVD
jgi:nucleoside-diphosphate-sugar epimerase